MLLCTNNRVGTEVWYTRQIAPRAAYAARYARSGRKSTSNYYAKQTEVRGRVV